MGLVHHQLRQLHGEQLDGHAAESDAKLNSPAYAALMKPAKTLRPRQVAILGFIREYIGEHGYAPRLQEIGEACGISSESVVHYNLTRLKKAGKLTIAPGVSRGIVLTDGGPCAYCQCPGGHA